MGAVKYMPIVCCPWWFSHPVPRVCNSQPSLRCVLLRCTFDKSPYGLTILGNLLPKEFFLAVNISFLNRHQKCLVHKHMQKSVERSLKFKLLETHCFCGGRGNHYHVVITPIPIFWSLGHLETDKSPGSIPRWEIGQNFEAVLRYLKSVFQILMKKFRWYQTSWSSEVLKMATRAREPWRLSAFLKLMVLPQY